MNNIKSLLDAAKVYPETFIGTALMRAGTTPSPMNKANHLLLAGAIEHEAWNVVQEVFVNKQYRKALDGLVCCLNTHDRLGHEVHGEIVKLFEEGNFI